MARNGVLEKLHDCDHCGRPFLAPHAAEARRLARAARMKCSCLAYCQAEPGSRWHPFPRLSSLPPSSRIDRRPVQHVEGGIIREVRVRDGQRVAQGEPLVVLGDVAVDADLNAFTTG